jgi:hypothetical protein
MENEEKIIDAEVVPEDVQNEVTPDTEPLEVISPEENVIEEATEGTTEEGLEENTSDIEESFQNLNAKVDMLSATVNLVNQNLLVHTNAYDQALQKEINDRNIQWTNISNNIEKLIESMKDFPENCKKHFMFIGGLTILNVIILLLNLLL